MKEYPDFDVAKYGEALVPLLVNAPEMPLTMPTANESMRAALQALTLPAGCRAALWLRHGFWEEAHNIAQDDATREGSYWHAILHRIEQDNFNANYWLRRVGVHPIHMQLKQAAATVGYENWTPAGFIDDCTSRPNTDRTTILRQVQQREWELLFDWCWFQKMKVAS